MTDRKFPIGPFVTQEQYTPAEVTSLLNTIDRCVGQYQPTVGSLSPADLMKTYREGSWTVQQLVHHVADIHLLHFLRMKKALTEPDYHEVTLINMDGWVKTADGLDAPVADSLLMLDGINRRYLYLARSLTEPMLAVTYHHPVRQRLFSQAQALAMSAWHVQHHLAHIRLALA
jgi:hypothetical protein